MRSLSLCPDRIGCRSVVVVVKGFLLVMVLGLVSCSKPPAKPLRIVSSPWPGYESLYLARDLGYFDQADVRLIELPSSNTTLEAFSNGSADIATLTLDETLTLLSRGRHVRILGVMDISNGADAVMARPEIETLADLKGKRVTIVNIPLGVYMLNRTLAAAGLSASDVTILTLPEDKHEKAYLAGKTDVAITFEPFKTRLADAGAHVLFDSSRIPNEIFDLLIVNEDTYVNRRTELCKLVQQWNRALEYMDENPTKAASRMAKRLDMEPDAFLESLKGMVLPSREENVRLLGGKSPAILPPAKRLEEIMRNEHMLPAAVDISSAIDPQFQECL
jgi:NitT/TauT family transport system substrate-binding protein